VTNCQRAYQKTPQLEWHKEYKEKKTQKTKQRVITEQATKDDSVKWMATQMEWTW
jgi:hypothetical protein